MCAGATVEYSASALCPDTEEPALYVIKGTVEDRSAPKALEAFAERSANDHGCDAPTRPRRPDPPQPPDRPADPGPVSP
ncbi:hypothetical protein [Streptomyces sp. NPDC002889]|uniref:hypothetical protein n=1 Tax=Streptomyces sp. NPDC002889 TaxID=3364669 RepID=UPI00367BE6B1